MIEGRTKTSPNNVVTYDLKEGDFIMFINFRRAVTNGDIRGYFFGGIRLPSFHRKKTIMTTLELFFLPMDVFDY